MKMIAILTLLFIGNSLAQDVVQVVCSHNSITARIQREIVEHAEYKMEDLHLNDKNCSFDEEDGDFFVRTISPLTACGTHFETNDTHVVFSNSISTVETGHSYPYGVVVGSRANNHVLSALVSCTYPIDLNVSTMFIPNISIVVIQMPDAFGAGEFRATMNIFTDSTYRNAYIDPPILNPDEIIYVGVNLMDETSQDVYLLVEECWGTISDDSSASPQYPLIEEGCPVLASADGLVSITQNGIGHQAMWNSPVFKFVGEGEEFDNVWLHCNLQLCINRACEPTCSAARGKRSLNNGDYDSVHTISFGPVRRLRITEISKNNTKTIYVETEDFPPEIWSNERLKLEGRPPRNFEANVTPVWNSASITVVAAIGGLAMLCLLLGLIAVIVRARNNRSDSGFDSNGMTNKAFE